METESILTLELQALTEYISYRVGAFALKHNIYYRVIVNKRSPFGWNTSDGMEFDTLRWDEHPMKGWGTKPDDRMTMLGKDIEEWRLWKNMKIRPFKHIS